MYTHLHAPARLPATLHYMCLFLLCTGTRSRGLFFDDPVSDYFGVTWEPDRQVWTVTAFKGKTLGSPLVLYEGTSEKKAAEANDAGTWKAEGM
jgi:hypothetical protein